ncbi:uncharacterized protein B0H18DRAFT_1080984 [Fomitopsis serialis]|uniref:uncharacterized protein n=1 Tax=Fomitopsis serialis TaxID=139415 RepID=UPI002007DF00|nr:uncharacterized protein B0H18DRAFT_1080984 [Neoantrodia serialis]KAH9938240.1 hypothetical protein B0H18DRAFT_1080984 [Neoantrodia serialis]
MKYVALLSGGKDSCYNLATAPPTATTRRSCLAGPRAWQRSDTLTSQCLNPADRIHCRELDSYLYQTVGQDAIQFEVISGAAVEQGNEYGGRSPAGGDGVLGDETEDLYASLPLCYQESHPGVEGVSVGAILSNYQRVRVEHVCRRLSLTPLCYLWQRDQAELLSEMIEAGMEAILIKMQPTLTKLNDLYGSHICGEGGEYETLTLDCPLFKHKIKLTEVETVIHSDNDFATVAYLRIQNAVLEPKFGEPRIDYPSEVKMVEDLSLPPLGTSNVNKIGQWVAVTDITANSGHEYSIEDEVRNCFEQLKDRLAMHSLDLSNCTTINIFLSSMDLFARVNAVYGTFFGSSPPARACVAVDLPSPTRVKLDAIAFVERNPSERQVLHVQGLSYWAPANIGPYSQAVVADERIFISGQIGLLPSSLTLPSPQSLALETALSLQHVQRVTHALQNNTGGGWDGHQQGVLYWLANASDVSSVRTASGDGATPLLYLFVPTLPKGALVEKQVILHTGRCLVPDEDDEMIQRNIEPSFRQGTHEGQDGARCHWEISSFKETDASVAVVCLRRANAEMIAWIHTVEALRTLRPHALSIRLFYRPSRTSYSTSTLAVIHASATDLHPVRECHEQLFAGLDNLPPATLIPCRRISSRDHDDWDYAMFIVGS